MFDNISYISVEKVKQSRNIYITGGIEGTFFICIDPWDTPEEQKRWWKFSTNPFDLDFMKFVSVGRCFLNSKLDYVKDVDAIFRYLMVFSDEVSSLKNASIIHKIFYTNGTISEVLEKNRNIKMTKQYVYQIKVKWREAIINWLNKLFDQFDRETNTIEYFEKYYNDWIRLVDKIQMMPREKYNILWRFINLYDIKSYRDFALNWKAVLKNNVSIKGLSKYDKIKIGIMFDVNGII